MNATGMEIAGATDKGPVRAENQDAWDAAPIDGGGCILVLADGMGGHADGAQSARAAVVAAMQVLTGTATPEASLAEAVQAATRAVAVHRGEIRDATGTTLVAAVVRRGRCRVVNVGDSRAYLVHDAIATQLTQDHSWVAEEVRAGRYPAEMSTAHPARSVLTRAVTGEPVEGDEFEVALDDGDAVVLCSDGLWEPAADRLGEVFATAEPLGRQATAAVQAALDAGSRDNVTVVACRAVAGTARG